MPENDPQGLYSALGVQSSASAGQIRAAYRKLAKETHPDTSGHNSAERFHRISAAYEILSDPIHRAEYDRSAQTAAPQQASKPQEKAPEIEPICCSRCGQVTAQPRSLTFFRVYGFILAHVCDPIEGIFCARCARWEGWKSSIITVLIGWWGRHSLFNVVRSILANGYGGKHEAIVDQRLMWHNARAFLSRGNLQLAYALARLTSGGVDRYIAKEATDLAARLEKAGVDPRHARLKDPWRLSILYTAVHMLMAFSLPGFCVAVLCAMIIGNYWIQIHEVANQLGFETGVRARPVPICRNSVPNGRLLGDYSLTPAIGHALKIVNESSDNVIVKVRDAVTGAVAAAIFVRANHTAKINGIADGDYKVQYALGFYLDTTCRNFYQTKDTREFLQPASFRTDLTQNQIVTQTLSYRIEAEPTGVTYQTVSKRKFGRQ
jgi:DnaJ domain